MLKKILKSEYLLLFVAFVFPIAISFSISLLNRNLPQLNFYIYFEKCLSVVKQNMGYYGTIFGLFLAMKKYSEDKKKSEKERDEREKDREEKLLERQQEREQELIRIQEESNLLREKEIENRKDNYRPTFVITNNKIKLLMRREDLYLENIIYYHSSYWEEYEIRYESENLGTIKSGEYIIEENANNQIPQNFFITAETILGEKILFGFLYGEYKIYKYLEENKNPCLLEQDNSLEKINKNWISYNAGNINEELAKVFSFNSRYICKRSFRSNDYLTTILNSKNYKELYNKIFSTIDGTICMGDFDYNYEIPKFTVESVINIISEVKTQFYRNNFSKVSTKLIINNKDKIYPISFYASKLDESGRKLNKLETKLNKKLSKIKEGDEFNIICILRRIDKICELSKNYDGDNYDIVYECVNVLNLIFESVKETKYENSISKECFIADKNELLELIEIRPSII